MGLKALVTNKNLPSDSFPKYFCWDAMIVTKVVQKIYNRTHSEK